MIAEELIKKFKTDRYALTDHELDEIYVLIKGNHQYAREIQENWLFDDYLSRAICIDRQMFPTQVLIRISDLEADQNKVLTMDQIINGSKNAKLTNSGRYTRKVSERRKSTFSSRRVAAPSGRQKVHKKSSNSNFFISIAALLILGLGFFYYQVTKNNSIKKENLPAIAEINNVKLDSGKIVSAINATVQLKNKKYNKDLSQLSIEKGMTFKVEKGGSLIFEFEDKTKVVMQENSSLKIANITSKELNLDYGQINCEVSKQISPFLINTKNSQIKVLGTVLNVGVKRDIFVPANETTELVVEKGSVEIENTNSKEKVLVSQGEYAVVNRNEKLESRALPTKKLKYNFSEKIPSGIVLTDIVNSKLEDGQLKVGREGRVFVKLKNTEWKFPLKVSINIKFDEKHTSQIISTSMVWNDVSYGIWTVGVEAFFKVNEWIKLESYITEDGYFYSNYSNINNNTNLESYCGRLYYLEKSSKSDELEIILNDYAIYEGLEISEIKSSEIPDFSEGKEIFRKLPRKDNISLTTVEKFPRVINGKLEYRRATIQTLAKPFQK